MISVEIGGTKTIVFGTLPNGKRAGDELVRAIQYFPDSDAGETSGDALWFECPIEHLADIFAAVRRVNEKMDIEHD